MSVRALVYCAESDLPAVPSQVECGLTVRQLAAALAREQEHAEHARKAPSLWAVAWAVRKSAILLSGFLSFLEVGLNFAMLFCITAVVDYLSNESTSFTLAISAAGALCVRIVSA